MAITNKEIIDKLDCLEARVSGNELQEIHQVVNEIKEILLDPEDGLIVRVNKNTYWRKELDADEFKALIRWKHTITHAMWIGYTTMFGIIIKLIFF
jgi:hydroxymethylpyrimidine pyrophosphatase-like HAD family hydrolase|tara:strand:+ start:322 stop:609 length:288 start_codon:yes stop_codon:yes gene_type:complete